MPGTVPGDGEGDLRDPLARLERDRRGRLQLVGGMAAPARARARAPSRSTWRAQRRSAPRGSSSTAASSERAPQSTSRPPIAPLVTESMRPLAAHQVAVPGHFGSAISRHSYLPPRSRSPSRSRSPRSASRTDSPRSRLSASRCKVCCVDFCYTRAREKLGGDDPMRAVLDLVERDGRLARRAARAATRRRRARPRETSRSRRRARRRAAPRGSSSRPASRRATRARTAARRTRRSQR